LGSRKARSGFSAGDAAENAGASVTLQIQQMLAQKHSVMISAETVASTRKARRLYLGNLPNGMGLTSTQVVEFFNMASQASGISIMPGDPVCDSWISPEGKYGFVEFRSIDECTAALALNGISLQGRQLVIKRPNDYEPAPDHIPTGVAIGSAAANATSSVGMSGMSGMQAFGGMPAMGMAAGGMGMAAGGMGMAAGGMDMSAVPGDIPAEHPPSTVLVLKNMVTVDELKNDEDFEDIMLDTKEECEKFGTVVAVKIPRPSADSTAVIGLGKVFVLFDKNESATKTRDALHGRLFDNRTVEATYMDEAKFLTGDFA